MDYAELEHATKNVIGMIQRREVMQADPFIEIFHAQRSAITDLRLRVEELEKRMLPPKE